MGGKGNGAASVLVRKFGPATITTGHQEASTTGLAFTFIPLTTFSKKTYQQEHTIRKHEDARYEAFAQFG